MVVKVSFSHHANRSNLQPMKRNIFQNYKPFKYMVYNKEKELEEYSGGFLTREDAIQWYYNHGMWLENQFKRSLILVEDKKTQLNLFEL